MAFPFLGLGAAALGAGVVAVRAYITRRKPGAREKKMMSTKVTPVSRVFNRAVVRLSGVAEAAETVGWAPMSTRQCIGFELQVMAEKPGGAWGVVHTQNVVPAFSLRDATGAIRVVPPMTWADAPQQDIVINRNNLEECRREFLRAGVRADATSIFEATSRPYFVVRLRVLYPGDEVECYGRAHVEAIGPVQAHRPPPTRAAMMGKPGAELLVKVRR